jgi:hypothetical protein
MLLRSSDHTFFEGFTGLHGIKTESTRAPLTCLRVPCMLTSTGEAIPYMSRSLKFAASALVVLTLAAGGSYFFPRLEAQAFSSAIRDVDNLARQPVFFSPVLDNQDSLSDGRPVNAYQVPPGKRLIITYIGFYFLNQIQGTFGAITVTAHPADVNLPITSEAVAPIGAPSPRYTVASQQVFMFGNPGDQIDVTIHADRFTLGLFRTSMISGYLVNLP